MITNDCAPFYDKNWFILINTVGQLYRHECTRRLGSQVRIPMEIYNKSLSLTSVTKRIFLSISYFYFIFFRVKSSLNLFWDEMSSSSDRKLSALTKERQKTRSFYLTKEIIIKKKLNTHFYLKTITHWYYKNNIIDAVSLIINTYQVNDFTRQFMMIYQYRYNRCISYLLYIHLLNCE